MSPDWSDITLIMPTNDDGETVRGCAGRVFINGAEIKSVSAFEVAPLISDEIPSVTLTIEPRNIRVLLDSDFDNEGEALVYNRPRKLRFRRQEG